MEVNSITNGVVIDHIRAGFGQEVLKYLHIDTSKNTVALLMNVSSTKHGRKDIIKLENVENIDVDVLGLIDSNITVNIIENERVTKKINLQLPEKVENVLICKNPRCICSTEKYISNVFHLENSEQRTYRCEYCDEIISAKDFK